MSISTFPKQSMVLCIDYRFRNESRQIEVTDESNDQLTLLKCDGTLFVYNWHEPRDKPLFDIANLHGVQLLDARKHSTGKKSMIIMLKDKERYGEDGYGEFLCEDFATLDPNPPITTRISCVDYSSEDEMVEVIVVVEKTRTLFECRDQLYTYPWQDKKPDFNVANIIGALQSPWLSSLKITMKDEKDPDHFYECDCRLYDGEFPTAEEKAIHNKISKKREQLDDIAKETAEILAKRPCKTRRIRRYEDLINMILPIREKVGKEDLDIIQKCINEIDTKYGIELDVYTVARNKSNEDLYRVKMIEAELTAELEAELFRD